MRAALSCRIENSSSIRELSSQQLRAKHFGIPSELHSFSPKTIDSGFPANAEPHPLPSTISDTHGCGRLAIHSFLRCTWVVLGKCPRTIANELERGPVERRLCCEATVGKPHEQVECGWAGRERLGPLQIDRNRVIENLAIELVAQNNHVLAVPLQELLLGILRIPDPGFAHEIKTGAANNCCTFALHVGAEEDRRPEDAFECPDQPRYCEPPCCIANVSSIWAALSKVIRGRLLSDRERRKENWD